MSIAPMVGTEFGILEGEIDEVEAWSDALVAMGSSPHMLEPAAVCVIGHAVGNLAAIMKGRWNRMHAMGVPSEEPLPRR